jgi:hypothetical protein
MAQVAVPGIAAAVAHRDQVDSLKGFDVHPAGQLAPVDADTVFQIASMSRPIASTIVAAALDSPCHADGRTQGPERLIHGMAPEDRVGRDWLPCHRDRFASYLARLRLPDVYDTTPENPLPPSPAPAYAGKYLNPFFGTLEVIENAGALTLQVGPAAVTRPLQHWNGDIFVDTSEDAYVRFDGGIRFILGADGRAVRVNLEQLDDRSGGDFVRVE